MSYKSCQYRKYWAEKSLRINIWYDIIIQVKETIFKEVTQLPNIKSSIRSVKTDAERRAKNAAVKSQIRTAARKTVEAVQAGAVEEAKQALVHATSVIDKAASKGVLHKNTAARKKSNLAAKVNAL